MDLESISNGEIRRFWFSNNEESFLGLVTNFDSQKMHIMVLVCEDKQDLNTSKRLDRKAYSTRNDLATDIDILLYL